MTTPWHRSAPEGCRKCHLADEPHYARGLCGECYRYEHEYGDVHQYPVLPLGQRATDSWMHSSRHATVRALHQRQREKKAARQVRIWHTDGPIITSCTPLPKPPPLPNLRTHRGGINLPARETRRAA